MSGGEKQGGIVCAFLLPEVQKGASESLAPHKAMRNASSVGQNIVQAQKWK